jgi:RNA polymerase sigma-70 factor, ECF subfamily
MSEPADELYQRLLVVRCQAGDEVAFAELVERFGPRVRYFLRKLLGSADGADDAWQDVWLDVFRHVPRLADPGAFRAWLYRVARDRAFGRLRRLRVELPLDGHEPAEGPDDAESFTAEDAARIHAALDRLPAEQREVLVLRFLEEMSYDEIARVVGCRPGTVRSRIHYGKQALRRIFEQEHSDE